MHFYVLGDRTPAIMYSVLIVPACEFFRVSGEQLATSMSERRRHDIHAPEPPSPTLLTTTPCDTFRFDSPTSISEQSFVFEITTAEGHPTRRVLSREPSTTKFGPHHRAFEIGEASTESQKFLQSRTWRGTQSSPADSFSLALGDSRA